MADRAPGLYDLNSGNLLASWDTLVGYGMDCEKDYSRSYPSDNYFETTTTSPYYVLKNNGFDAYMWLSLVIPDSVKRIGSFAFAGCGLSQVTITNGDIVFGEYVFSSNAFKSLIIPDGMENIPAGMFSNCNMLALVTIPVSVTSIGAYAFSACSRLDEDAARESVIYAGTKEQWEAITIAEGNEHLLNAIKFPENDEPTVPDSGDEKPPVATITYKGDPLTTLAGGEYATLHTTGAMLEGDIRVEAAEVAESSDPVLQEKTTTENGEVTPDEGYDGLSKVTVNVPTGGGGECSGNHIIEVDTLPTENIDENAVYLCGGAYYKVGAAFTDVILVQAGGTIVFSELAESYGMDYSFNEVPSTEDFDIANVLISDLETCCHLYYFHSLFGEGGDDYILAFVEGPQMVDFNQMMGLEYKGTIHDVSEATEGGCYALMGGGSNWQRYGSSTGTLAVTANGTHDVSEYAKVNVKVPIPDGYIQPEGTKNISTNGTHDVTKYASASVSVPTIYIVSTQDDLPADTPTGSLAIVVGGN